MECENYFCVYQKDGKCILDSISLDTQGSFLSCIYVNIDDDVLEKEKAKILKRQEKYYIEKISKKYKKSPAN